MSSIGITVYGFRLQNKETNQNYLLNHLEEGRFLDIFASFIEKHSDEYINNEKLEKILKVTDSKEDVYEEEGIELYDFIIGKIKTGAYGYSAEIVDTNTGVINYNKDINDAEVMPFFFALCIPRGETDRGLLILQTHGIYGIKTIFTECLETYLKEVNYKYNPIIGTIAPRTYVERYLEEGILQKVRFIRYDIPQDTANQIGINNGIETSYEEYTIHKPLGFLQQKGREIQQCINGQRAVNNIVEIGNFNYDNVKLEFKLGRKSKTINLDNIDKLIISEDITDLIDTNGGHPTTESIIPILIETGADYLRSMGLI